MCLAQVLYFTQLRKYGQFCSVMKEISLLADKGNYLHHISLYNN